MRTIWLIRHAQSESNAGLFTRDVRQIRLTALGEVQAQYVAHLFEEIPSLIVTSPYLRTQQTAQPTQERFPQVRHEEWPVEEFTYLSLPTRDATTSMERRPFVQGYWQRADPLYVDGPGAESFVHLIGRIRGTLDRLKESREMFTAIFTHGLFIRTLLWMHLSLPDEIGSAQMKQCHAFCESFTFPNAGVLKVCLSDTNEFCFSTISIAHLPEKLR